MTTKRAVPLPYPYAAEVYEYSYISRAITTSKHVHLQWHIRLLCAMQKLTFNLAWIHPGVDLLYLMSNGLRLETSAFRLVTRAIFARVCAVPIVSYYGLLTAHRMSSLSYKFAPIMLPHVILIPASLYSTGCSMRPTSKGRTELYHTCPCQIAHSSQAHHLSSRFALSSWFPRLRSQIYPDDSRESLMLSKAWLVRGTSRNQAKCSCHTFGDP